MGFSCSSFYFAANVFLSSASLKNFTHFYASVNCDNKCLKLETWTFDMNTLKWCAFLCAFAHGKHGFSHLCPLSDALLSSAAFLDGESSRLG